MSLVWLAAVAAWAALPALGRRRPAPRAGAWTGRGRWCWYGAAALLAIAGEPPLAALARRSLWAQALQFGLLAFGVTPLAVLGLPPALRPAGSRPAWPVIRTPARAGIAALACFLSVTIGWRVPAAVDAVASGPGWLALEAVTVVGGTWWLWSLLAGTARPPLAPSRTQRVALAAVAAWSVWIFAYVVGFSAHPFYPAFAAGPGSVGRQELVVGVLLVTSAAGFCPVFFVNLTRWLVADQAEAEAEMARYRPRRAAVPGGGHD